MSCTNKTLCPICGKYITNNNIEKHLEKEMLIKKENNRIIHKENRRLKRESRRKTSRRLKKKHIIQGFNNKGRTAWNKGLTKDDPRIQKRLETFRKNKELGLHKDTSGLNNINSRPEVRLIKSLKKKKFLKENPDKIPYLLNHSSKISYPEKYFKELFDSLKINLEFQYSLYPYFLDFAKIESKIDIEIDGGQHTYDKRIVEHDKKRNDYLEKLGWKIIRIKWSEYKKMSYNERCQFVKDLVSKLEN